MPDLGGHNRLCPWCLEPTMSAECPRCGSPTFLESEVRPDGAPFAGMVLEQDRYRVLRRLGSGGMGTVYQAFDHITGRLVAIKFVGGGPTQEEVPPQTDRMVREAMATARIDSPHVVRFLDFGRTPQERPFLVMELLNGSDLREWLDARQGVPLPAGRVVRLARQICAALEAAHSRGFVHRDLKPANIFLETRGDGEPLVKVLDFGLAREAHRETPQAQHDNPRTVANGIPGTPDYMAPELGSNVPASPASDLYSLGLILWEMLAGRRPQTGPGLSLLVKRSVDPVPALPDDLDIPEELADLVCRLLEPSPARRPGSAHAVGLELARLDAGEGLTDRMGGTKWIPAVKRGQPRSFEEPASPRIGPHATMSEEPPVTSVPPAPPSGRHAPRNEVWIGLAILLGVLAVGFGWWLVYDLTATRIADVKAECGRQEKPVTLSAQVVRTVNLPFTDMGAYKVSDGQDELWVVSIQPAPPKGAEVRVIGRTYDADRIARDCESTGLGSRWCQALSAAIRFITGACVLVEEERQ